MREQIETILTSRLNPTYLQVVDNSAQHAHHPEALQSGGGHYSVIIVSKAFTGKKSVERHRMIYKSLEAIKSNIHALAIKACTPDEVKD